MTFDDPLKLKVELVVEPDNSNADQTNSQATMESVDSLLPEFANIVRPNISADSVSASPPPDSLTPPKVETLDQSLTPWKNRFAEEKAEQPNTWYGKLGSIVFKTLDYGALGLSVVTLLSALFALIAAAITSRIGPFSTELMLGVPIFIGFFTYPLFVVRLFLTFASLKPKFFTFFRGIAPAILANTMTVWGMILAMEAIGIQYVFKWIKESEASIGHQHIGKAMAGLAFGSAGLLQLTLILLLIISMVVYLKLFQWIDKRSLEIHGVSVGGKKAGLFGIIVGALFGLCGLYLALSVGGPNSTQSLTISTLVWATGVFIACLFLSTIAKLRRKKIR